MTNRRDPFAEVEELLDAVTGGMETGGGSPPADVADTGEEYVVVVDLPGYEQDNVTVTLPDPRTVQITASREGETVEEADQYVVRERHSQSVSRRFSLPEPVDEEATSASYENGVLTVTLPRQSVADDDEGTSIPVE